MTDNTQKRQRYSTRVKDSSYSKPGAYLITTYTYNREPLFGEVVDGKMLFSRLGLIAREVWLELPHHYPHVALDAFCIMPNLFHGIIVLIDVLSSRDKPDRGKLLVLESTEVKAIHSQGLSEIVRAFKSVSARLINASRNTSGVSVWQRGYYKRALRGSIEMDLIREAIENRPLNWKPNTVDPIKTLFKETK